MGVNCAVPAEHGPLSGYLLEDHARLDALLRRVEARDHAVYDQFRAGLLRHIGMEEKILLPAAQRSRGGEPPLVAAKLRADHGALASLLMLPPRAAVLRAIRLILAAHNKLEEGAGGLYETSDRLLAAEADRLLEEFRTASEPVVAPTSEKREVVETVRRIVERAGYHLNDVEGAESR
jgi:hypothetical protein